MDLFEHEAKELFAKHGVPVPVGRVATTSDEAAAVATELAGRVVVKAQVKTGGRGKAGGVKLADGPDEARAVADQILGMDIKGHTVHRVLVEQASSIAQEYYVSYLLDRANRNYLVMASSEGGMEIEEVAARRPEALVREPVSILDGVDDAFARKVAQAANLPEAALEEATDILRKLWEVLVEEDATLVEVNPLILTADGRVVALDGKVTLDNNARFRQPDHARYVDVAAVDPLEQSAREKHLNYVKLEGQVGVIGNGAGLVMSTLDVVAGAGEEFGGIRPANFLDIGGGASAQVMADGLHIVLSDPSVRSVLVNVFGGITACDAVATGIVGAMEMLQAQGEHFDKPIVVRLDGNNAEEGRRILFEAEHELIEMSPTMDDAAKRAAELAAVAINGGA